ncbi:MAG TPA: cytochrome c family protein [Caulobacteraceae bacterium]|jgi:cytochrome c|nr:cytochrome c family protein [Caulobacteraceae bacterium]
MKRLTIGAVGAFVFAGAAAASPAGDPVHGQQLFSRCAACHSIDAGGPNRVGPNLHGVLGRNVAAAPGFRYSDALKAQSFVWDDARLDRWLTDPRTMVPGTLMILRTQNPAERRDLIAYLHKAAR